MGPVLKAWLAGTPLADLGEGAEGELRADFADEQAEAGKLAAAWDEMFSLLSRLSDDMDAKGREYAEAWHPDERLRSGLFHVGWAYNRAQQGLAHVLNLMRTMGWGET